MLRRSARNVVVTGAKFALEGTLIAVVPYAEKTYNPARPMAGPGKELVASDIRR